MEELDKKNLERIAQKKEYFERQSEILDKEILAIQKSTKTSFRLFDSIHNKLRAKWHWYYKWHLSPLSNIFHYIILTFAIASVSFYGMVNLGEIQRARASSFVSVISGDWNNPATWGGVGPPSAADSVTIASGTTVTVTADASIAGITVVDSATAILSINAGQTLTASGTVTIGSAGFIQGAGTLTLLDTAGATLSTTGTLNSRVRFDATSTQAVTVPARTYGGVAEFYSNSDLDATVTLAAGTHAYSSDFNPMAAGGGTLIVSAATNPTINVAGNVDYTGAGAGSETMSLGSGTWTVSGNWDTRGGSNLTKNTSTIIMNGNSKSFSSISNESYNKLTISNNITTSAQFGISTLTIDTGCTLTASSGEGITPATLVLNGTLNGSGVLNFGENTGQYFTGSGNLSIATVKFAAVNNPNQVPARIYNSNVTVSAGNSTAADRIITIGSAAGQTLTINGNLTLTTSGTNNVVLDADTYDPTINITGNIANSTTSSGARKISMGSGTWTVYGNVDLTGSTVTAGASTLDFAKMTGTQTFNGGGQSVGNLTHSGAGALQITGASSVKDFAPGKKYAKTSQLTINHALLAESKTNFPVLYSQTSNDLKSIANGGSVTSNSGYDILFTDSNGKKLDHEIEQYDPVTGELTAWILFPSVSNTSDTIFNIFIGKADILSSQADTIGQEHLQNNLIIYGDFTTTAPVIDLNSQTLSVGGNFVGNSEQVFTTTGTLDFNSTTTGHTIGSNGMTFPNISFTGAGGRWSFSDNPTILNNLTINTGAILDGGTRTIAVGSSGTGSWVSTGTFNCDQSIVDLRGTGTVNINSSNSGFYDLRANGQTTTLSGWVNTVYLTLGDNTSELKGGSGMVIKGQLTDAVSPLSTNGAVITSPIRYTNNAKIIKSTTYSSLTISCDSVAAGCTPDGDITATALSINSNSGGSTSTFNTNGKNITASSLSIGSTGTSLYGVLKNGSSTRSEITINGAVSIRPGSTLGNNKIQANNMNILAKGDWRNDDVFVAGDSTVTFNGTTAGQTLTTGGTDSNHAFNNIVITNTHSNGITFADDATMGTLTAGTTVKKITVTAGKTLTATNLNLEGNHSTRLAIASSSAGQTFNLAASGTKAVSYVDVRDSVASSEIVATESKDSTGNTNWMLVKTLTFDITSTNGNVQTPTGATITAKDATGANTNAVGNGVVLSANHGTVSPSSVTQSSFTDGTWSGEITLSYVGAVTVTAMLDGLSPLSDSITLAPGNLDHFTMTGTPGSVTVQSALTNPLIVTAYDAYGNVKIDYTGQIYFTSSDGSAVLPYVSSSKYTFVSGDAGWHSFLGAGFTLKATGNQTITVSDGDAGAPDVTSSAINVTPAAFGSFTVTGFPDTAVVAGQPFSGDVVVTAKDIYGNVKTDYTNDFWFSSNDTHGSVVLPCSASSHCSFQASDNGVKTFAGGSSFALITANTTKTITLTNGSYSTTSSPITITPAGLNKFAISGYPRSDGGANQWVTAGYTWDTAAAGGTQAPYNVAITAQDTYGNTQTDFQGKVWFTVRKNNQDLTPKDYDNPETAYDYDFLYYANSTGDSGNHFYQFTADDHGAYQFNAADFMINVATGDGIYVFRVNTDVGNVKSDVNIKVKPSSASTVAVKFNNSSDSFNYPVDTALDKTVDITILDAVGNVKTDYEGSVWFASNDTTAELPCPASRPCSMVLLDSGSKSFAGSNFTFHNGGQRSLTVYATKTDSENMEGTSPIVTVSGHAPTDIQATAGHQQVTLDWVNPVDSGVSSVKVYQKTSADPAGDLGTEVSEVNVTPSTSDQISYSQKIVNRLINGTTYIFTLKSVIETPLGDKYLSEQSESVFATPADIAAREVTALQASNGQVSIEYKLYYTSDIKIQYYNPANLSWNDANPNSLTGDYGLSQPGSPSLTSHRVSWLARADFPEKYYSDKAGFKIRVVATVTGTGTASTNSVAIKLDTKAPANPIVKIDASDGTTADLVVTATDDSSPLTMMISNNAEFSGASWAAYPSGGIVNNWDLQNSETVYVKLKDSYSNIAEFHNDLVPVVDNFMLKDNSDLRTPAYQLVISWADTKIDFDKYIIERQTDGGAFTELVRTNQSAFLDIKLSKDITYGYRVKILDKLGNISRPSTVLSSKPGLAPDVTSVPQSQVFGYRQDVGVKVVIKWNTDQSSDSFVAFSTERITNEQNTATVSGVNANIIGQLDRVTAHEVSITNLLPGKKYYMKALSQNDQKITGYSNVFEIETPAYVPLQIKGLEVSDLRTDSAWVNWTTNKVSKTTVLLYGQGDNFDKRITDNSLNSDHKFKLENLSPGVMYRLKIEATDEDGNVVNSDEYSFTPPAKPEISKVAVSSITNNSVTVTWTTNVNTNSNVQYGPTTAYGLETGKSDLTTEHSIIVVGLEANTTYHFKAKSTDSFNNTVASADSTFTTISDTTAPALSEIQSQLSQVSSPQGPKYQAVISWKTDEGSTSQVEFGDNAAGKYTKKTQEDQSLNMTHVVILSDLKPNSAYSYRIISKDKSSNQATSTNYTIITPPQEKSLVQVVLNNLQDTFSWVGRLKEKWFK